MQTREANEGSNRQPPDQYTTHNLLSYSSPIGSVSWLNDLMQSVAPHSGFLKVCEKKPNYGKSNKFRNSNRLRMKASTQKDTDKLAPACREFQACLDLRTSAVTPWRHTCLNWVKDLGTKAAAAAACNCYLCLHGLTYKNSIQFRQILLTGAVLVVSA